MYKTSPATKWLGCLVPLVGFLALATCMVHNFGNMRSDQTAEECQRQMTRPVLFKTAKLPSDEVLREKRATIEHLLHGNKQDMDPLRVALSRAGWRVEETAFEVGAGLKIIDDPVKFRRVAARRIAQICRIAASSHVEYESWWISAPQIADYVSQNAKLGVVTEVPNE